MEFLDGSMDGDGRRRRILRGPVLRPPVEGDASDIIVSVAPMEHSLHLMLVSWSLLEAIVKERTGAVK
ncbi:unnamed protein product [Linum trigynum]|uniref:Uncharacterized protein n=1 Tax=Linum trigynum TaxID=586398 RepID=A0AAV2CU89_9ROSI